MNMRDEAEDRAAFCWKRAVAVRAQATALSAPETRATLLQMADDYERMAETLTREVLLGAQAEPQSRPSAH